MNILLTSAGRRAYIVDYFKLCNGIDKVYASNSEFSIALKRADGYFISPLIYDGMYIPSLISFCLAQNIKAVLSLFDIDLLVLAKNRDKFEAAGIHLVLAPVNFVEICNDKWQTYNFLLQNNIKTPKTFLSKELVKEAIRNKELSYPIIMKPRWGMASMGIYKVYDDLELDVFSKKCHRDIFNSYLKYESSMTFEEAIIYQEIISGEEYGLDVINDLSGNYIGTFAKQKVSMRSGETDLGRTAESNPFEGVTRILSQKSHHEGILSVDCFRNEKGIFVIEMNCRISGHYPLSHLAGVNYPQLLIDWLNKKTTDQKLLSFTTGLFIVKDLVPTILYNNL